MPDIPMKMYWMGEDVETLDKPELIKIIRELDRHINDQRKAMMAHLRVFQPPAPRP